MREAASATGSKDRDFEGHADDNYGARRQLRRPGARGARPAVMTPISKNARSGRVSPVFEAQLAALRAPVLQHDAIRPPTRPIDGRTRASTSRRLSTHGSGAGWPHALATRRSRAGPKDPKTGETQLDTSAQLRALFHPSRGAACDTS